MKRKPTLHGGAKNINPSGESNPGIRHVFQLGMDVDLRNIVMAVQCDGGEIARAQPWSRARLLEWVRRQVSAGHAVHSVYEACGFGYTLHRELSAAGAHSIVTTPMRLSLERQRKNDRMDAVELCLRLARWREGRRGELKPIRIPSAEEQEQRELGRQREFFKREVRRLENHGRALRIEFEHETLPGGWAGPRKWKRLALECSPFVREQLQPIAREIRSNKAELTRLSELIEARVAEEQIPQGLGALTLALVEGEVCDWQRFRGRKAIGSYTGCCPSEHSSGGVQRFGHIDRHGNKHLRVLLVEAVWRLLRWQPNWHARQKYLGRLTHGASLKKKTAVALARQLAIDLWRWRTGRATAADLGWELRPAPNSLAEPA